MAEYRNYQVTEGSRVSTGATVSVLASVIISALLTCWFLSSQVTKPLWNPPQGIVDKKFQQLASLSDEVNWVFVGPSHLEKGVVTSLFDRQNSARDWPTSSYNLSMVGTTFIENRTLLQRLSEMDLKNLQYVVYEPRLKLVPDPDNLFTRRVRYHYNFAAVSEAVSVRMSSQRSTVRSLLSSSALSFTYLLHLSNLGVLSVLFLPAPASASSKEEPLHSDRGYISYRMRLGEQYEERHRQYLRDVTERQLFSFDEARGYRPLSQQELQIVLTDIDLIEAMGAIPIILLPPSGNLPGLHRAIAEALSIARPQLAVLDYSYRQQDSFFIYRSPQWWFDDDHLSDSGAELFTARLAEDLYALTEENR